MALYDITNRLARLKARAASLETSLDKIAAMPFESASYDSGEGKQSTKYKSFERLMADLDETYAAIEKLIDKQDGKSGITICGIDRHKYFNYDRYFA